MPLSINKEILHNEEFIRECYRNNNIPKNDNYFSLVTSPFKVLKLKNVLTSTSFHKDLLSAVDRIDLDLKENDLYALFQSQDLCDSSLKPIRNFINILQTEVKPFLSRICNVPLSDKLSITVSQYKYLDYLLCHDDKCDDRCIAFVYYLTEGNENSGGLFEMFEHDDNNQPTEVVRSILPELNSFLCFEVGNLTYHQVSEVTDSKFSRLSINGWFHSDRKIPLLNYEDPLPVLHKQVLDERLLIIDEHINQTYCTRLAINQLQENFECESSVLLKNFFNEQLHEACSKEFSNNSSINWLKKGPANRRHYYTADLEKLPTAINTIVKLLMSPVFINYLKNITSLSLEPYKGEDQPGSQFSLEVIKWSSGCYTMATDNDAFFKKHGLDLYIFFCTEKLICADIPFGYVIYLDSKGDDGEVDTGGHNVDGEPGTSSHNDDDDMRSLNSDKELITIVPENNSLSLVYRTDNTIRFTKYISRTQKENYYAIYATYYEDAH